MNNKKTLSMVLTGLFMAIIAVMTFIPNVGYINLIVIKATLLHVPVIVGSIVLGPKKGAVLGATFGITSLIKNTLEPSLLSFAFSPFSDCASAQGIGRGSALFCVRRFGKAVKECKSEKGCGAAGGMCIRSLNQYIISHAPDILLL